ncbi:hypothetical protein RHGRI_004591 [Rhododendron griersonianum]|uniref:PSP proline-rich domain-containing protein n=1 Tax=Rhododendron griersonianum TaxID=479676 RepID=A0AAV6LAE5_9ERIC|nr:hypothetical protein RHGRI_004591 [Rhododendron griersonianum]
MTAEVANGVAEPLPYPNGGIMHQNPSNAAVKKSRETERRRRRKQKKKNNKASQQQRQPSVAADDSDEDSADDNDSAKENGDPLKAIEQVEVEYVPEKAELYGDFDEEFRQVFEKFSFKGPVESEENEKKDETAAIAASKKKADSDSEEEEQDAQQKDKGVSNKKKKLQRRMKIAELKQISTRPDVVEVWDATASDPKLLVFLKSYRNTVPVPRHWCQKRKFLQGSGCDYHGAWTCRCLTKGAFGWFLVNCWMGWDETIMGSAVLRNSRFNFLILLLLQGLRKSDSYIVYEWPELSGMPLCSFEKAYIEKEDSKKLKQKQRERMQPRMGKMDIDYQVLHDAFFKYQTKPKLTAHGDLYHEGKEFEVKLREMKPGMLSQELKEALGMPEGAPPPWLINMQRYGPPPSYPHLKIPGLNAPIPPGASFGYHPGGWGKPPVDEFGRPLYGDVFGVQQQDQPNYEEEPVDKTKHWGDLEEEEEEEEEEVEEPLEEEELEDGIQSVDSLSSTPTGVETPDVIDLRKQQRKEPEKPLYQVLEEKEEKIAAGTLLGTTHTYVIGTGAQDKAAAKRVDLLKGQKSDRVDVTLQPEELELMDNVLPAKYEEAREEEKLRSQREDFSDMVAENEKKRKRKMQEKEGKSSKKRDFKF